MTSHARQTRMSLSRRRRRQPASLQTGNSFVSDPEARRGEAGRAGWRRALTTEQRRLHSRRVLAWLTRDYKTGQYGVRTGQPAVERKRWNASNGNLEAAGLPKRKELQRINDHPHPDGKRCAWSMKHESAAFSPS